MGSQLPPANNGSQKKSPWGDRGDKADVPHKRVNYEDHSQKFLNWVDHLGLERTFFGRLAVHLEEKFSVRRFAFVFLFSFTTQPWHSPVLEYSQ